MGSFMGIEAMKAKGEEVLTWCLGLSLPNAANRSFSVAKVQ